MRIMLLGRSLEIGGAEGQLAIAARALAARHHEVSLALLYGRGSMALGLDSSGVKFVDLRKTGRYDVIGFLQRFRRVLREIRPDVIYAHLPVQNLLGLVGRTLYPPAVVVWGLRGSEVIDFHYDRMSWLAHKLQALASGHPDWTVVNSHAGARYAFEQGFRRDRLSVIPNGIDLERFRPDPTARAKKRALWGLEVDTFVIGHVGRIDPMKDHNTFFEALATVVPRYADVRAVCVAIGSIDATEKLRGKLRAIKLTDRVRIIPACEDVAETMAAFDLFCSSSAFGEGFSNVIAEAMACGVPCLATDVGDARTLIREAGVVVPPRRPDELAKGLLVMYHRHRIGEALSANVLRATIAPYSPAHLGEALETLFQRLVNDRHGVR